MAEAVELLPDAVAVVLVVVAAVAAVAAVAPVPAVSVTPGRPVTTCNKCTSGQTEAGVTSNG